MALFLLSSTKGLPSSNMRTVCIQHIQNIIPRYFVLWIMARNARSGLYGMLKFIFIMIRQTIFETMDVHLFSRQVGF